MTHSAQITQADMERACKAVKAAGFEHARVIMDLNARTIEIIVGDDSAPTTVGHNEWDRE